MIRMDKVSNVMINISIIADLSVAVAAFCMRDFTASCGMLLAAYWTLNYKLLDRDNERILRDRIELLELLKSNHEFFKHEIQEACDVLARLNKECKNASECQSN